MQLAFGPGQMVVRRLTNADGSANTNPTPIQFGAIQGISFEFATTNKQLRGQNQFPISVGRGPATCTGKIQAAQISSKLFNEFYFGQTLYAGNQVIAVWQEAHTIPTTPFTITITPSGGGTFLRDLGVSYGDNGTLKDGTQLTRVATATNAGEYSVNESTGVYTFTSADQLSNPNVQISYEYTASSTAGFHLPVNNVLMGQAPTFQADIFVSQSGQQLLLTVYQAIAGKFSLPTKLDDFLIVDWEFDAFANAAGNVIQINTVL